MARTTRVSLTVRNAITIDIIPMDLLCLLRVMSRSSLMVIVLLVFPLLYMAKNSPIENELHNTAYDDSENNAYDGNEDLYVVHNNAYDGSEDLYVVHNNAYAGDANPRVGHVNSRQWWDYNVNDLPRLFHIINEEGMLEVGAKALYNGALNGHDIISEAFFTSQEDATSTFQFPDMWFDFVLWVMLDPMDGGSFPVGEIERTLKTDGVLVTHLNQYTTLSPIVLSLMPSFKIIFARKLESPGLDILVGFKKVCCSQMLPRAISYRNKHHCRVSQDKISDMKKLENILLEQPSRVESEQNWKGLNFLPDITGFSDETNRYVYIDVGTNAYESSTGAWFNQHYPKHGHTFEMYAIQADVSFQVDYSPQVNFLHHIASAGRSLVSHGKSNTDAIGLVGDGESNSEAVGLDLGKWLMQTVKPEDHVVMKMDIRGAEFEVLPRMIKNGAICLVDELFLECHYEPEKGGDTKWKHRRAYWECLTLFGMLRDEGVAAHQWWG